MAVLENIVAHPLELEALRILKAQVRNSAAENAQRFMVYALQVVFRLARIFYRKQVAVFVNLPRDRIFLGYPV